MWKRFNLNDLSDALLFAELHSPSSDFVSCVLQSFASQCFLVPLEYSIQTEHPQNMKLNICEQTIVDLVYKYEMHTSRLWPSDLDQKISRLFKYQSNSFRTLVFYRLYLILNTCEAD